ncbi:hypothetical protein [Nocardioides sp. CFH 31398]|uniref:hypothetical protein n=1 Tax=Nocardioides sp. CFH 31398 TaxID=2919579 RepID=UPI001F05E24C|nr:hypothetical protein [Nocardioides sp. CFH 31398]MCH1867990.1 hypothetical protein [Nocardioides sp. CFH 31398]
MALSSIEPAALVLVAIACSLAGQLIYWRLYTREREKALAEGRHTVRSWPGTEMRARALRSPAFVGLWIAALTLLGAAGVLMLIG